MKKCWIIYTYRNELSGFKAKKIIGDSYEEIQSQIDEWYKNNNIEIIDVTESVFEEDKE